MATTSSSKAEQTKKIVFAHSFGDALKNVTDYQGDGYGPFTGLHIDTDAEGGESSHQIKINDVIYALWLKKPKIAKEIIQIRKRDLPITEEEIDKIISQFDLHMKSFVQKEYSSSGSVLRIRHWQSNNCGLQSKDLFELSALLCGHASLASAQMNSNELFCQDAFTMKRLACAINLSNVLVLELSNNMIGTRSMVEFLKYLHAPSLRALYISITMLRENLEKDQSLNPLWKHDQAEWSAKSPSDVWKAEIEAVTDELVTLIRNDQTAPYAPRLTSIHLNGNDLGWKSVKRITSAVLQSNRCLEQVELFSTTDLDQIDGLTNSDDEEDELDWEDQGRARSGSQNGLRRASSIGTHFISQRREQIAQIRNTESNNVKLITYPDFNQFDQKITKKNYRNLLDSRTNQNKQDKVIVQDASRKILRTLRTLTCKCREGNKALTENSFPFTRLPSEIRQRIVMNLEEAKHLSRKQIERIISFASDPATIGYGQNDQNLGLSQLAMDEIRFEIASSQSTQTKDMQTSTNLKEYGLLLHQKFCWTEMINKFSVPRDWPATVSDELEAYKYAEEYEIDPVRNQISNSSQIGKSRRKWLALQSGLQAFIEATGTHAKDESL